MGHGRLHGCGRWVLRAWVLVLFAGVVLLLVPEARKTPLLAGDPWAEVVGFFANSAPARREVSPEFSRAPGDYLRSWEPQQHATPGRVVSRPFTVPRFLAVPYAGYPGESGITLCLERLDTGEQLRIARGNAHENWVERTLWLPRDWPGRQVRLLAVSTSTSSYVAVGVPHTSSLLAWLKESVFVVTFLHALTFLLLLAPGAAVVALMRGPALWCLPRSAWILPFSFLFGYGAFFLFHHAVGTGRTLAVVVTVASLLVLAWRRRHLVALLRQDQHAFPLGALFVLSLAYVLLLYSADDGLGTWAATYRFTPAVWSSDNQLPQQVAEAILHRQPFAGLLGPWRVSDRPPLLTGIQLLQSPAWEPLLQLGSNGRLLFYFHQLVGIIASTYWVLPVCLLCQRLRGRGRWAPWLVGLAATTGFFTFHSLYIWPKLLAGALGLGAFACLLARDTASSPRPSWREGVAAGLFGALALLAHGGVVFGLVAVAGMLLLPKYRPRLGCIVGGVAVCGLVLAPWSHWQRTVDPPGNALIKSAFAHTHGWGEEHKGVLPTVVEAYQREGLDGWLDARRRALATLVGWHTPDGVARLRARATDPLGAARARGFAFVLDALGVANLGWVLLWGARRQRVTTAAAAAPSRPAARWLAAGALGVALNLLLTWDMHVVHHQSYLSMALLLLGLFAVLLDAGRRTLYAVVGLHVTWYLAVWVVAPFTSGATLRPDHLIGFVLAAAFLVVLLVRWAGSVAADGG